MKQLTLADRAAFIITGNVIRSLCMLLLPIILVRIYDQHDYGTYRQVWLLYGTLSVIFILGVPKSIYFFVPQLKGNERVKFLFQSEVILSLMGLLLTVIIFFSAEAIGARFQNPQLPGFIRLFCLYFLFAMPLQWLVPFFISVDKHQRAMIVNIVMTICQVGSILIPALLGFNLYDVFKIVVAVAGIQFLILVVSSLSYFRGSWRSPKKMVKSQLSYSVPIGLTSAVGVLSRELDKFIVSMAFLPSQFAIYTIGAKEVPLVSILPYTVSDILIPKLSKLHAESNHVEFIRLWHESIRKVGLIMLPVFAFLFLVAEELIVILFTDAYLKSAPLFRIYLCLLPLRTSAYGPVLLSVGLSKTVLRGAVLALGVNVLLNILFLSIFGFNGPALATLVSTSILVGYYLVRIKQALSITMKDVYPWQIILRIFSVVFLSTLVVFPITLVEMNPILIVILTGVTFAGMYILFIRIFKLITPDDIDLIKRWILLKILFRKS